MSRTRTLIALAPLVACLAATSGHAGAISVANGSFETLPAGGLPYGCGVGCSYSVDTIPGWTDTGNTGQFQPGSSSGNFAYFNYVPDGLTVAYTNGGDISQTVGATATPGVTYTLQVALGLRNDGYPETGAATLIVDGHSVVATGVAPTLGNWSTYTASYTATAADAGGAISIDLSGTGPQADFDNVSLVSSVPEPASWALMILGSAAIGGAVRRRKAARLAA